MRKWTAGVYQHRLGRLSDEQLSQWKAGYQKKRKYGDADYQYVTAELKILN